MSAQTKGLAALLAAQGRYGDDELIHVNKRELAALERLGNKHGIATTTNPRTGLKEAFNWLSTLGGIAGGVAGTFIAPGAGTAAGAALGSGLGTAAGGGTTEQALTNGLISGVTAYAGAGLADSLAQAGTDVATQGVTSGATDATASQLPGATGSFGDTGAAVVNAGGAPVTTPLPTALPQGTPLPQGVEAFAKPEPGSFMPDTGYYGAENVGKQGVNTYSAADTNAMRAAAPEVAPSNITSIGPGQNTLSASGTNPEYWSNVGKGIGSLDTPSKAGEFAVANKGNLVGTATGLAGIATAPESASADEGTTGGSYTGPRYRGEVYYTPYGERRTRAVPYARGGDVYGDYEGVDEAADGGYIPGGGLNYASGGGISSLGYYSDGGRMLRGPGDGVSDSIPASIEGKRPARLADGEFVIPARAVSELGNGSTEAGSKQLYAMLDRIAKKRKKGSGLAYQANPKKLMPV